jgi:uncharacterized membrane protein YfcA
MESTLAELAPQGHIYFILILIVVGVFGGYVAGLFGIGGGTFAVPFYRFFHDPLKRAIALSSATGIFIGLDGGVAGRAPHSLGYVSVSAFLILTPCMMTFSPLGSRAANALPERLLKRLYIVFLAGMTVYMAVQTYAGMSRFI